MAFWLIAAAAAAAFFGGMWLDSTLQPPTNQTNIDPGDNNTLNINSGDDGGGGDDNDLGSLIEDIMSLLPLLVLLPIIQGIF